jgi:DNA-binding protein HU-beta
LNKTQFIDAVAARLGADHKSTAAILDAILDEVYTNVSKGEKVILTGFGAFERRDRAARIGRNPATGAKVRVKKTSVPAFRPGTEFKEIIAGRRKIAKAAAPAKKTASKAAAPAKKAASKAAAPAKKAATTAKAAATKTATAAKKAATPAKKSTPAAKTTARKTAAKAPATKAATKRAPAKKAR